MSFSDKEYDRLYGICERWTLPQEDVFYAIENNLLRVCVWLPLRFVERGTIKDGKFLFEQQEYKKGFLAIRSEDFRRIYSKGRAKLRIFHCVNHRECVLRLAYEPPQPSVSVRIHDLVILREDRIAFEKKYQLTSESPPPEETPQPFGHFYHSDDYRYVSLDDKDFHLGDVQARVIEQLHDAAHSRTPWVHGKTLLYESGSNAVRLRDLFRNKRTWRGLIISNERGYYRLNVPLEKFQQKPADSAIKDQDKSKRREEAVQ